VSLPHLVAFLQQSSDCSFPEYVEHYTRDVSLEALARRYMLEF
jgi:hypothetical protein